MFESITIMKCKIYHIVKSLAVKSSVCSGIKDDSDYSAQCHN